MIKLAAIAFVTSISVALCAADITGTWKGSLDMGNSGFQVQSGQTNSVKAPTIILVLKKDGVFEYSTSSPNGGPKQVKQGTWSVRGSELTLTPSSETVRNNPKAKVQKLVIGKDEKSLSLKVQARVGMGAKPEPGAKPVEMTITFKK